MSITNSAVLVELGFSIWTANKIDKGETDKVTTTNKAVHDAAQVRKNLMAGTTMRKEISDFAQSCRNWHVVRTLPWSDGGLRLLPTGLFFDYKTEMNERRTKFWELVNTFTENYPALVKTAHNYLGDLFDPSDYPNVDAIRDKFDMRLIFSPVPEGNDFRLKVGKDDLEELRSQYEASFEDRVNEAMGSAWQRMHTLLSGMSDKLKEDEGSETKRKWHKTFITNAQQLCSMLTHLNITNDPKLEKARQDLEKAMYGADIEDIRDSEEVRKDIKGRIDTILGAYEW